MTTFAVTMVKDEADIVEGSITRMLAQVDAVIVADNGSTDGTREILQGLDVELIDDPEVGYYQAEKMSRLAAKAAEQGATWVVPFDADEVWRSPHGRVADVLATCPEAIAAAEILNYVATDEDDPSLPPIQRLRWRLREALGLPKVACRAQLPVKIHQGNHGAEYTARVATGLLEVHHFPYRSEDQFLSKVVNGSAAYRATDLPPDVGLHWREYGQLLDNEGPAAVKAWFRQHFLKVEPEEGPDLTFSPCPSA